MSVTIDYHYVSISPFTYLGHSLFHEIAARYGATIAYKPVRLPAVWAESGAVPLGQRPPARQRYRLIELQRFAEFRGLPINMKPKHFPVDSTLADRVPMVLAARGENPAGYLGRALSAVWANEQDISERATVAACLEAGGVEAEPVMAAADSAEFAERHEQATQDAIASGAMGVPTYVLGGEPFWGQDRLELLERALASGRKPFTAP